MLISERSFEYCIWQVIKWIPINFITVEIREFLIDIVIFTLFEDISVIKFDFGLGLVLVLKSLTRNRMESYFHDLDIVWNINFLTLWYFQKILQARKTSVSIWVKKINDNKSKVEDPINCQELVRLAEFSFSRMKLILILSCESYLKILFDFSVCGKNFVYSKHEKVDHVFECHKHSWRNFPYYWIPRKKRLDPSFS